MTPATTCVYGSVLVFMCTCVHLLLHVCMCVIVYVCVEIFNTFLHYKKRAFLNKEEESNIC